VYDCEISVRMCIYTITQCGQLSFLLFLLTDVASASVRSSSYSEEQSCLCTPKERMPCAHFPISVQATGTAQVQVHVPVRNHDEAATGEGNRAFVDYIADIVAV